MAENFYEDILIKLRRKYGKDELVSSLLKELSECKIEIGQLKSEIDFMKHELETASNQKEINKLAKIEFRKDEINKIKDTELTTLRTKNRRLVTERNEFISKCIFLQEKLDNLSEK